MNAENVPVAEEKDSTDIVLTLKDDPELIKKLVESFAPEIVGHDAIKEAILLALVGAVPKPSPAGIQSGTINVLIAGPSASGKTSLLRATDQLAYWTKSCRANELKSRGFTLKEYCTAMKKDPLDDGIIINFGTICTDDINKAGPNDLCSLAEIEGTNEIVVEDKIVILMQNVIATTKMRKNENAVSIIDTLLLPGKVDGIFDLICVLSDTPDDLDEKRALQMTGESKPCPPLDHTAVKKYVEYARNHCEPTMGSDAAKELAKTFAELRREETVLRIGMHILDVVRKVAEAHARLRLSEYVLIEDVKYAYTFVLSSWRHLGDPISDDGDETQDSVLVKSVIHLIGRHMTDGVPLAEVKRTARECHAIPDRRAENAIKELVAKGEVLQLRPGLLSPCDRGFAAAKPKTKFEQLVLTPQTLRQLEIAIARSKQSERIMKTWGLGDKVPYGTGVTLNFRGSSGTGKSMAAHAFADAIGKSIICVPYDKLIDKYVGETEKNIQKVFAAAKNSGAVLFFDEADAVAFSRGLAQHSWELQQVNTLLRELEQFDGVCIFATNLVEAYDPAFQRRLTMHIEFPQPTEQMSRKILDGLLPKEARADDIDTQIVDVAGLSGGDIKNVVLRAAGIAAAAHSDRIHQEHLEEALRYERERTVARPQEYMV